MKESEHNTPSLPAPLLEELQRLLPGKMMGHALRTLLANDLISHTNVRAFVARAKVGRRCDAGEGRIEAMKAVAQEMGCSLGTIKNYLYYHRK
ncbi:MAG: hypothetical protein J6V28_01520 [Tidjanibacter sp.]|nr:hypothetical protein [Tidjanibacter sp.]